MRAQPDPRSKLLTAVCLNCDGVLYKRPYQPWVHDDSGQAACPDDNER